MKYIVFWTLAFMSLNYVSYKNEFGIGQIRQVREVFVYDTLKKEFHDRDSAIKFMERCRKYKPDRDETSFIDTVWMDTCKLENNNLIK